MALAILIGGILMIWLTDRVATFLERNRMYEVLGLFVLFVVGIMQLTEGAHLAHLHLAGNEITPMTKTTFHFIIGVRIPYPAIATLAFFFRITSQTVRPATTTSREIPSSGR